MNKYNIKTVMTEGPRWSYCNVKAPGFDKKPDGPSRGCVKITKAIWRANKAARKAVLRGFTPHVPKDGRV